jgi:hypothetical protein
MVYSSILPVNDITTIIIEDGAPIESVGYHAFSSYTKLESLTLHLGLMSLDMSAFFGCPKLTEINLPATVEPLRRFLFICGDGINGISGIFVFVYEILLLLLMLEF